MNRDRIKKFISVLKSVPDANFYMGSVCSDTAKKIESLDDLIREGVSVDASGLLSISERFKEDGGIHDEFYNPIFVDDFGEPPGTGTLAIAKYFEISFDDAMSLIYGNHYGNQEAFKNKMLGDLTRLDIIKYLKHLLKEDGATHHE